MSLAIGILSLAVTVGLFAVLLRRYWRRPGAATGCWLAGIGLYGLGISCQIASEIGGLSPMLYRVWYLSGAYFAAAYLGAGSLYRLASPRLAGWTLRALLWLSVVVAPAVLMAPVHLPSVDATLLTGAGFPPYVRAPTPLFNGFGTLSLVGVAAWSALGAFRTPGGGRRALSLGAIAAGALIIASGGTLHRFGFGAAFYPSQLVGITMVGLGVVGGFGVARSPE